MKRQEMIWADQEFFNYFQTNIVRDEKVRRALQKRMPQQQYFKSWGHVTREIARAAREGRLRL